MTDRAIVIEPGRCGGWELRLPGDPPDQRRCTTQAFAERVARSEAGDGVEIIVRDAYHRVLRVETRDDRRHPS